MNTTIGYTAHYGHINTFYARLKMQSLLQKKTGKGYLK